MTQKTTNSMEASINTKYIVFCPTDASDTIVEFIASELELSIIQEEELRSLGINIDDLL
jgi:hypothetical protein